MHGGILMTMNEKERGMKCGRIHRSRRVMLPIPAFMLLCMVFIMLAGTAAAIMPFPSSELLPVDELLSVLYAANSSHSDESCEQPNIPAFVSGERGEEDSARVVEALQNFLNTGETVNLEKMLHPAHLSALREGCGKLVPTSAYQNSANRFVRCCCTELSLSFAVTGRPTFIQSMWNAPWFRLKKRMQRKRNA